MAIVDEQLLKEEVDELTELLRRDPQWAELRGLLSRKGFEVELILMAGFMEDEHGKEYGAFVTREGAVYQYERGTGPASSLDFQKFWRVRDLETALKDFPSIAVALKEHSAQ
jgi:hypothetical protein